MERSYACAPVDILYLTMCHRKSEVGVNAQLHNLEGKLLYSDRSRWEAGAELQLVSAAAALPLSIIISSGASGWRIGRASQCLHLFVHLCEY